MTVDENEVLNAKSVAPNNLGEGEPHDDVESQDEVEPHDKVKHDEVEGAVSDPRADPSIAMSANPICKNFHH